MAAGARGAVALADHRAGDALAPLRRALSIWTDLSAPYEIARVRERIGLACRALEDEDTARLELEAAREAFDELGATADRARVEAFTRRPRPGPIHGLTGREIQVLRCVAAGKTNREIATELFIS